MIAASTVGRAWWRGTRVAMGLLVRNVVVWVVVAAACAACGQGVGAQPQDGGADGAAQADAAIPVADAAGSLDAGHEAGADVAPADAHSTDAVVPDAAPVDAATPPTCPCFAGDGLYCATAIASYGAAHACGAPALATHAGDVYQCTAGAWSVAETCGAAGCYVAQAGSPDGCHVAGATKTLWVVFNPSAKPRDLQGLFQCLLAKTDFNDRARAYAGGYGLAWGGSTTASCAASDYACGVKVLAAVGHTVADHDVVELVQPGYCGGDNDAHGDGVVVGSIRVRGANVGDCAADPAAQERVAVHEAFECAGDWADADCCTGEVAAGSCPDNGEAFCPSCPCSCGKYQSDGTYGCVHARLRRRQDVHVAAHPDGSGARVRPQRVRRVHAGAVRASELPRPPLHPIEHLRRIGRLVAAPPPRRVDGVAVEQAAHSDEAIARAQDPVEQPRVCLAAPP